MATLQGGGSPGSRIEKGDNVLASAASTSTKLVSKRLASFKKIHLAYTAADAKVKKTADALEKQQAKVGEADAAQDEAAMALASALAGDGLSRQNPFKSFGQPAPAQLCRMGYDAEADALLALEKSVLKKKTTLSAKSIQAAKAAGVSANRVKAALEPIEKLEKAHVAAMAGRDALAQAWETALATLKRGARAAEDEGAAGLFAALFEKRVKVRAKKKAAPPAQDAAKTV